jgi:hypothetical protein
MRTRSAVVALVVTLTAGLAAPAFAHEEISPKTFPTGQPTFLTLTAANEAPTNLVKLVLHAPAGLAFGEATRSPAGWSVSGTDDTLTWTGGAVRPHTFETFGYEVEGADQPGTRAYTVTLGYADGKSDDVEVDVSVVAPGAGGLGTGAASSTTVTTAASTSPTTAAPADSADDSAEDSDGASGTAKAALAISIVALLAAAGALALSGRRRGSGPPGGGGGAAGGAQDW